MNAEEQKRILELAAHMRRVSTADKDSEAYELIRREIASQPHAIYRLTQVVLLQWMALEDLQKCDRRTEKRGEGSSFLRDALLSSGFGLPSGLTPLWDLEIPADPEIPYKSSHKADPSVLNDALESKGD